MSAISFSLEEPKICPLEKALNRDNLPEITDRIVESGEEDHTASLCRLILPYTSHEIHTWTRTSG